MNEKKSVCPTCEHEKTNGFIQNAPIKTDLIIEILDKNGNVIKTIKKEQDLLVKNACRFIYGKTMNASTQIVFEDGYVQSVDYSGGMIYCRGYGTSNYGYYYHWREKIAVGTDNTPTTVDDYALKNKIAETTGLFIENVIEEGQYLRFDVRATFYFATETTIGEAGLFGKHLCSPFLVARDTLDVPIVVPADSYLVVRYRFYVGTL